jgi:hypothetical protein
MRGAIPPVPNTSSWRGAQLKHRDVVVVVVVVIIIIIIIIIMLCCCCILVRSFYSNAVQTSYLTLNEMRG